MGEGLGTRFKVFPTTVGKHRAGHSHMKEELRLVNNWAKVSTMQVVLDVLG